MADDLSNLRGIEAELNRKLVPHVQKLLQQKDKVPYYGIVFSRKDGLISLDKEYGYSWEVWTEDEARLMRSQMRGVAAYSASRCIVFGEPPKLGVVYLQIEHATLGNFLWCVNDEGLMAPKPITEKLRILPKWWMN